MSSFGPMISNPDISTLSTFKRLSLNIDLNLDNLSVYIAHLDAPHPVKPDDGAVAGVAGHQDVRHVPDGHHGHIVQVPRSIPSIPEADQ